MTPQTAMQKGAVVTRNGNYRIVNTTYVLTSCCVCGIECLASSYKHKAGRLTTCGPSCRGKRKSIDHTGLTHLNSGRYVIVHRPDHPMSGKNGKLLEHRLVMSEHLGRLLGRHEVVHHKDGNRSNNSIENLELLQGHKAHAEVHAKESELYQLRDQGLLRCSSCREIKPLDAFSAVKSARYGRQNQCKECRAEAHKRSHPDARPHDEIMRDRHQARWLASEHYKLFLDGKKKCRACGEVKPVSEYSPYKGNKDNLMSYCKACRRAKDKAKHE